MEAAGKRVARSHEAGVAADPFQGGVRVHITGPQGFERTVFDCKGISAARRERIEAAVEAAAGQRLAQPYESWTAVDRLPGGVRLLNTGPQGFERTVAFALDEAPKRIVSPAARRRISAAQRKRRAAVRNAKAGPAATVPTTPARKKRRLSPEGRARFIAATKKRRSARRKAKATGKSAARA